MSGGVGVLSMPLAGSRSTAFLDALSARDVDVTFDWSLDKLPSGSKAWVYQSLLTRRVPGTGYYKAVVRISPTGEVRANFKRNVGSDVMIGREVVLPLTYTSGDVLRVRTQTVGVAPTTLRLKVWKKGTTEPTDWSIVRTDSTLALEAAGSFGLISLLSSSATNAPIQGRFDGLLVQEAVLAP